MDASRSRVLCGGFVLLGRGNMPIPPYIERATKVACDSQIAVQVLLSRDNDALDFVRLKPHQPEYIAPEEFTARQLRSVGVVGMCGTQVTCAFKEPLDSSLVNSIAVAFVEHVRVLLGASLEQTAAAEPEPEYDWNAKRYVN